MALVAFVTLLALLEYVGISVLVSRARGRYGVKAPATSGHEIFERYFRVQQNTVEQLLLFLPSLWIFSSYVSAPIGALLGLVFIAGRAIYLRAYVAEPSQRSVGFLLSFAPSAVMLVGGLVGTALAALRG
ncbi:MAG TPA: MAPEG family protein [Myxococcota bacterium]|nr:MAPEG family protein [Myxococcota bacterium]